ncbi:hypothetical protein JTB14_018217 [Gonioctena quinquepunctata]|nr:hypothetical protein JTB14_018217 [Gonioctena quinquepunctata]
MVTRNKHELQALMKDTITELLFSEVFSNQIIKTVSDKVDLRLEKMEDGKKTQEVKTHDLEQKIENLQQQAKMTNICIYGMEEKVNEQLITEFCEMINNNTNLSISNQHIMLAYRIGRKTDQNMRPVIMKFINYDWKITVMKSARSLKGKKIFITEDLIKSGRSLLVEAKAKFGDKNSWCYNGQIFTKIDNVKKLVRFSANGKSIECI